MKDSEDVHKLLRLKRYESPGEEYFQKFAEDFKDRQRSELLKGSARSLLFERVTLWLDEMSPNRWFVPATACAAAVTVGAFLTLQPGDSATGENAVAEVAPPSATLPDFQGATDEVIELSLPKPSHRVPGGVLQQNDNVLTAGADRGFREL